MVRGAAERPAAIDGQDKFSIAYFVWIVLVCLLFASGKDLDRIFHLWLALVPLLLLPALAVTICWIVALVRNIRLRRWRRVASVLAAPIAAYVVFAAARAAGVNSEWIRFEIGKHYYFDQIAALPPTGELRFKIFEWGETGGAGVANSIYTLIYDESDEISLPPADRSKAWLDRANKLCPGTVMRSILNPSGIPTELSVAVKKIDGHFYLVTLSW
jgi:hypothetical protein